VVNCVVCGRRAVYIERSSGYAYCERHFLKLFSRRVKRTIRKYGLFREREDIVVAVSGGKDSLALLHFLLKLSKKVRGWRVRALLIDEGISGYREVTKKDFIKFAEEWGVEYRIASFKEEVGLSLDEMVEEGRRRGLPYLPCTYCGVFRRYLLNKVAREMGATVLATAHNLDDVIQTYVMNVIVNNLDKLSRLGPKTGVVKHPKFVPKVKPFYEVLEKEVALYAVLNNIYPSFTECPYARLGVRWTIREMINKLEEKHSGIKHLTLRSLLRIISLIGGGQEGEGGPATCRLCGEPSAHEVCRACQLKMELGLIRS